MKKTFPGFDLALSPLKKSKKKKILNVWQTVRRINIDILGMKGFM